VLCGFLRLVLLLFLGVAHARSLEGSENPTPQRTG
jgi:hypothetical protein